MNVVHLNAALLAMSKHQLGGTVGIIVGVLIVLFAALRVAKRAAGAMLMAGVGLVVLIVGILLITHAV